MGGLVDPFLGRLVKKQVEDGDLYSPDQSIPTGGDGEDFDVTSPDALIIMKPSGIDVRVNFVTPTVGVRYTIYKGDDTDGIVSIYDHNGVLIEDLIFERDSIDVYYKTETEYFILEA